MRLRLVSTYLVFSTIFAVGVAISIVQWYSTVRASMPATPVVFDHGLTSFQTKVPKGWTNESCKECHQAEYEQWRGSRHANSGTNANFRVECLTAEGGRQSFCMNCHAPRNPFQDVLPTQEPLNLDQVYEAQPKWLTVGVDCITCHVRDGKILATKSTDKAIAAHPMRVSSHLGSPEFCGSCHQFGFKASELPDGFRGQKQQASLDEYLDFRRKHGTDERCQDCHMPSGDHSMPGGYSLDMIKGAFTLDVNLSWKQPGKAIELAIVIDADHVGHRVPGGEHFRYLTLHTSLLDADGKLLQQAVIKQGPTMPSKPDSDPWPRVEAMRRIMLEPERGLAPNERPNPDTRLHPGEKRQFRYLVELDPSAVKFPLRARSVIKYHLMSDTKAARFGHGLDEVISTTHEAEAGLNLDPD